MDSGKDDMDIQVVRWKEKKADYEAKQKLWEGEADSGLEAKKVTEKLQEIKRLQPYPSNWMGLLSSSPGEHPVGLGKSFHFLAGTNLSDSTILGQDR